jgi:hypothetical protein
MMNFNLIETPVMSHSCADLTVPGRAPFLHWTLAVVDLRRFRFLVPALPGWLNHEQEAVVAYLVEENRSTLSRTLSQDVLYKSPIVGACLAIC